jgi:hypothetical protein
MTRIDDIEWERRIARAVIRRQWANRHVQNGVARAQIRRCVVRLKERRP